MTNKESLRVWAKNERLKLDIIQISSDFVKKIKNLYEYKQAKNIMIYYPVRHEVNLLELLKDKSKNFYLPKIDGENMCCCSYKEGDKTCLSKFKTCEPLTDSCDKNLIDLVIVPALAVDKNGYRLGYGGGFYDRFLADFKGVKLVCVPQTLVVDSIYPEKHDIKMDIVIMQAGQV